MNAEVVDLVTCSSSEWPSMLKPHPRDKDLAFFNSGSFIEIRVCKILLT